MTTSRNRLIPIAAAVLALGAGLAIAWVDSRPGWDDAGIMAAAIIVLSLFAALARVHPLLAILLVAGPIVATEITRGPMVLLSLAFAALGAFGGASIRRMTVHPPSFE